MKRIINHIQKNVSKQQIYIIGIDGSTGSGKSTLVKNLEKELIKRSCRVVVLHIDDFIHPKKVRYNNLKEEWCCYYYLQWRYDYLIEEILKPIKMNYEVNKLIELYDKENDKYNLMPLMINKGTVILLEGVFLQKEEIQPFLDYIVFLDVSREERLDRVLKRDTYMGDEEEIKSKYNRRYFPAEDMYVRKYDPINNADLVLLNEKIREGD